LSGNGTLQKKHSTIFSIDLQRADKFWPLPRKRTLFILHVRLIIEYFGGWLSCEFEQNYIPDFCRKCASFSRPSSDGGSRARLLLEWLESF